MHNVWRFYPSAMNVETLCRGSWMMGQNMYVSLAMLQGKLIYYKTTVFRSHEQYIPYWFWMFDIPDIHVVMFYKINVI